MHHASIALFFRLLLAVWITTLPVFSAAPLSADRVASAFGGLRGAFVQIDVAGGDRWDTDATAGAKRVAPCSSFKVWNAAIGLEEGVVRDPDAPYWKWDGKKRFLEAWSADQTLRSAMAVSCVPAFQQLARDIGEERMRHWIAAIGFGSGDISAGLDVFWLPAEGRQSILISAEEQAALLVKLLKGQLPFSDHTRSTLRDILRLQVTPLGTLYGKTGSGQGPDGLAIGWFVGWVESAGRTLAFACRVEDRKAAGKDARRTAERLLAAQGFLSESRD